LWPLVRQTVEATIEGLEKAWAFFQGCPKRLVLDNFPAAVAGTDPLNPRPTRPFLEYSQARGFLLDPARVRHPRDKPQIERFVQYARGRFWKGGTFLDLDDARRQAGPWCLEVAGQRVHGTTRKLPLVVFEDEERAHLLPYDGIPYDVPLWRDVTVHPDHHVSIQYALYSAPSTTCPPGTKLAVRCDRDLIKLYKAGALVKVHPREPKGGRSTDPDDYPPERTAYAMRAPDRLVRQAVALGPQIGQFAERLLDAPFPWSKLRQGPAPAAPGRALHARAPAPERSASTWSTCAASSAFWCWPWNIRASSLRQLQLSGASSRCRLLASPDPARPSIIGRVMPPSQSWTERRLTPASAARSRWISPVRPRCRRSRPRKLSGSCDGSIPNAGAKRTRSGLALRKSQPRYPNESHDLSQTAGNPATRLVVGKRQVGMLLVRAVCGHEIPGRARPER
jgi:hypothetical protein